MPEHCEVDENGSHGSDVGWGQKTDMCHGCNLVEQHSQ